MGKNNLIQVLQDWELLLSEISRNGTALDNDALDVLNETIRAALAPVDVDLDALTETAWNIFINSTKPAPWNQMKDVIQHLAARGCLGGAEWKPIETAPKKEGVMRNVIVRHKIENGMVNFWLKDDPQDIPPAISLPLALIIQIAKEGAQ